MRACGWILLYLACAFLGAAALHSLQAKTLTLLPLNAVASAFGTQLGISGFLGTIPAALPLLAVGSLMIFASSRNKHHRIFGPRRRRF
jgi:hypothetical protein